MTITKNKNPKEALIESIKVAGNMLVDMAEDIAGKTDLVSELNVSIDFPKEFTCIPEITITRSHVPSREALERILDIYNGDMEVIRCKEEQNG